MLNRGQLIISSHSVCQCKCSKANWTVYKECNDNPCVSRQPKACKYFTKHQDCKCANCVYYHENIKSNSKNLSWQQNQEWKWAN